MLRFVLCEDKMFGKKGNVALGLIALCLVTLAACEVDMTVRIDGKNPPTFTLNGSGNLERFVVMEVPPENQTQTTQRESDRNILLWEIRPPNDDDAISRMPEIIYGKLPAKFIQVFPADGSMPSPLIEGKIYEVGGTAHNANGGMIWIKVRGDKTIEIPIPGSTPGVRKDQAVTHQ
jgi:hypothetical protein